MAEIADGPSLLASRRGHGQVTTLSIRVDGNRSGRPSQRTSASGRFRKSDGEKIPQSSDGNSSNQEEIISLFRRIQSSISKGESISSKKRNSKSSEEKPSAESVLEVLRQSRKQVKGMAMYNIFLEWLTFLTSYKPLRSCHLKFGINFIWLKHINVFFRLHTK